MRDRRVYLRVKIKSLAAEAVIIRHEEQKSKHQRNGLAAHRRTVVRSEARYALLAYGFLKGKRYDEMERGVAQPPDWDKVKKMVEKYGVYLDDAHSYADYKAAKEQEAARFVTWKPQ